MHISENSLAFYCSTGCDLTQGNKAATGPHHAPGSEPHEAWSPIASRSAVSCEGAGLGRSRSGGFSRDGDSSVSSVLGCAEGRASWSCCSQGLPRVASDHLVEEEVRQAPSRASRFLHLCLPGTQGCRLRKHEGPVGVNTHPSFSATFCKTPAGWFDLDAKVTAPESVSDTKRHSTWQHWELSLK